MATNSARATILHVLIDHQLKMKKDKINSDLYCWGKERRPLVTSEMGKKNRIRCARKRDERENRGE